MNIETIFHQFKLTIIHNFDNLIEPVSFIPKRGNSREIRTINALNQRIKNDYFKKRSVKIEEFVKPFSDYGFYNVATCDIRYFYKSEDFLFNKFEKNNIREMFLNVPLFALECVISGDKFLLDINEFCDFVRNNDIPEYVFKRNIPSTIPLSVPDEIHIFAVNDDALAPKIKLIKKLAQKIGIKVIKAQIENFEYNLHTVLKSSHRPLKYFGEYVHARGLKLNITKLPIISLKYNSNNKFIDFSWSDFNEFIVQFENENQTIM